MKSYPYNFDLNSKDFVIAIKSLHSNRILIGSVFKSIIFCVIGTLYCLYRSGSLRQCICISVTDEEI